MAKSRSVSRDPCPLSFLAVDH